jgi:hypothetical protein
LRRTLSIVALLVVIGMGRVHAAEADKKGDAFLGAWSGTWTGGSDGSFEMTISKGTDGKLAGSITPSPNNGETYSADFQTVVVEDQKLTATFDSPDGAAVVTMTGALEGGAAKGTYGVREKQQGTEVESGTWTVKKK